MYMEKETKGHYSLENVKKYVLPVLLYAERIYSESIELYRDHLVKKLLEDGFSKDKKWYQRVPVKYTEQEILNLMEEHIAYYYDPAISYDWVYGFGQLKIPSMEKYADLYYANLKVSKLAEKLETISNSDPDYIALTYKQMETISKAKNITLKPKSAMIAELTKI